MLFGVDIELFKNSGANLDILNLFHIFKLHCARLLYLYLANIDRRSYFVINGLEGAPQPKLLKPP